MSQFQFDFYNSVLWLCFYLCSLSLSLSLCSVSDQRCSCIYCCVPSASLSCHLRPPNVLQQVCLTSRHRIWSMINNSTGHRQLLESSIHTMIQVIECVITLLLLSRNAKPVNAQYNLIISFSYTLYWCNYHVLMFGTVYLLCPCWIGKFVKGILHFFGNIGSFYNSFRVKQLSFTVFKCIQLIFWYLDSFWSHWLP